MNTISFLSGPLLWGMALAAIPIIIHLLFRRKYRRVDWAPMRYLKLSLEKHRRRIRLEQLLLLLLRVSLIVLLFFLLARPVMHAEGLGAWLGAKNRKSQFLLVDDSLSMGYRTGGKSAFERAQDLASDLVEDIGPQDRLTLVAVSQPEQPLFREVEVGDRSEIGRALREMSATEMATVWRPTFEALDELVAASTYPIREVTVITDLRKSGWDEPLRKLAQRWTDSDTRLRVFDVGDNHSENVALEDLRQVGRLALVGVPTRWEAHVRNNSGSDVEGLEAEFAIDGKPTAVRLPAVAPGEVLRLPLTATFQKAGPHHVSFLLPEDELPTDNQRWSVARVKENLRLVLVDGEPAVEPLGGEVDFLAIALSLPVGRSVSFHVRVITEGEWSEIARANPDLVVLANVARLTPAQAKELYRLVQRGTGLMIFPGDQIDPDNYNVQLFEGDQKLLPASLESVVDEEVSGLVVEDYPESPLEAMLQLKPAVRESIRTGTFFRLLPPGEGQQDVRVVARWNNAQGDIAAVERIVGKGRVLLWTVTADKRWSGWPTEPSYVLAMREAVSSVARTDANVRTVPAGGVLRYRLPANQEVKDTEIEVPRTEKPLPLAVESEKRAGNSDTVNQFLVHPDTRRAGLYRMAWREPPGEAREELFAVNPDARESQLERIDESSLRQIWTPLDIEVIHAVADEDTLVAVRGEEIWRTLAVTLLGMMVVETCFATWAGRGR